MTALAPCPECKRHVATHERTCPFCASALPMLRPQRVALVGRVSRAAVFSAALVACSNDKPKQPPPSPPVEHAPLSPPVDATVAEPDAASEPDAAIVDAGAPPDAGVVKKKHHDRPKAIEIQRAPIPKPYGAPPARKRIV